MNFPAVRFFSFALLYFSLTITNCNAQNESIVPFSTPFSIVKKNDTRTISFKINQQQTYAINLNYIYKKNDHADRAKVWQLAGGQAKNESGIWSEAGAQLRIRLRLNKAESGYSSAIYDRVVSNPHLSSWGDEYLTSRLAQIRLEPGIYTLTLENLDHAPLFENAKLNIQVVRAYNGK